MTEHDEGFAAAIEAALAEVTRFAGHDTTRLLVQRIRALKPAPRSAEHAAELSAQERERWKLIRPDGTVAAVEQTCIKAWARIDGYKPTVEGLLGYEEYGWRVCLATAPSTHKFDEMIELQRNTCDCVNDDYFRGLINGMILAKSIIEGGDEDPKFVSKPDARNVKEPAVSAFESLKAALKADPSYAWSWHCNLAMPIMDSIHCSSDDANKAGADLMRYLFDIDIRTHENWHHDPVGTPDARSTSDAEAALKQIADHASNGNSHAMSMQAIARSFLADRATRSTDSSAEAAALTWAAGQAELRVCGEDERSRALWLFAQFLRKHAAEAAKLTTAPHTADETRVDGEAT